MPSACLQPRITHSFLPLCIPQALSHLSQNWPHSAASFISCFMLLAPCLTPCTLEFSRKPAAGHTGAHTCRPWSVTGPRPGPVRTGSVKGPSVLSNQAGHGNLRKWSNYKLAEWLKFPVLEIDRNGFGARTHC